MAHRGPIEATLPIARLAQVVREEDSLSFDLLISTLHAFETISIQGHGSSWPPYLLTEDVKVFSMKWAANWRRELTLQLLMHFASIQCKSWPLMERNDWQTKEVLINWSNKIIAFCSVEPTTDVFFHSVSLFFDLQALSLQLKLNICKESTRESPKSMDFTSAECKHAA